MGRSRRSFATLALQGSAPCAADAAAIGVHRVSRRGRARPAPSAALGFGNVRAQVQRRQIHQDLVAVIPLVGDDFLDHAGVLVCRRGHRFEVLGGRRRRVRDGRGIPLVGALDRHPDDGAGLQVDRVLGLVREVCVGVCHRRKITHSIEISYSCSCNLFPSSDPSFSNMMSEGIEDPLWTA